MPKIEDVHIHSWVYVVVSTITHKLAHSPFVLAAVANLQGKREATAVCRRSTTAAAMLMQMAKRCEMCLCVVHTVVSLQSIPWRSLIPPRWVKHTCKHTAGIVCGAHKLCAACVRWWWVRFLRMRDVSSKKDVVNVGVCRQIVVCGMILRATFSYEEAWAELVIVGAGDRWSSSISVWYRFDSIDSINFFF